MQAAAAYACIANGGEWVKPHLVNRVMSPSGDVLDEHQPERRQVVSEATAATLKAMLEGVVVHGTGKAARVGGYSAAGKTGTAQKVDEATGRYSQTRYVASFAGLARWKTPKLLVWFHWMNRRGRIWGARFRRQSSLESLPTRFKFLACSLRTIRSP